MSLRDFITDESGAVATIDWLVILGGLTASGLALVEVTTNALSEQSETVRGELQDHHFETSWIDNLPVGPSGQGIPGVEDIAIASDDAGNGNNGHGNDSDGNDDSNPGASNDSNDHTDDDGSAGGSGAGTGGGGSADTGSDGTLDGTDASSQSGRNPNGNNGHGNDDDGNDDSNPGASNTSDDHDDQDGTPGGLDQHVDGDGDGQYWMEGEDPAAGDDGQSGPVIAESDIIGCPSNDYIAEPVARTGSELENDEIEVDRLRIRRPSTHLTSCEGIDGTGYFFANPTYTLDLSEMNGFDALEVALESRCNTTLLVQDAQGTFHFDDDSGDRRNARVMLYDMDMLEGRVNIWVGTYRNRNCNNIDLSIEVDD